MKIETFSILAGSEACNARCPFCVSKMTPPQGVALKEPDVNWRNFHIACKLARQVGVTTAMFTGKGEPTLFPDQISRFLREMKEYNFPLIEIQTNGIKLIRNVKKYEPYLQHWYREGMTTIAISIVHFEPEKNREIYLPHENSYIDLPELINWLHSLGFSVRLTCIAANGFIDDTLKVLQLKGFAKENKVEQLTITPVNKPESILNQEAYKWTKEHHLTEKQLTSITSLLEAHGRHILTLAHGAKVYDMQGQNICLNQCLTVQPDAKEIRNLIFFPDGHLRYDWQYPGAVIL